MDDLKRQFLETLDRSKTVSAALKVHNVTWSMLYNWCRTDLDFHLTYETLRVKIAQAKAHEANIKNARSLEKYLDKTKYKLKPEFESMIRERLQNLSSANNEQR